ncbi:MAG: DNA double-strand break repair nuclease NurA [Dehalococcoidia bacterium]|nr:DNA double-strand break repair nuclease NurA [Dehalococcoidia bacterium]
MPIDLMSVAPQLDRLLRRPTHDASERQAMLDRLRSGLAAYPLPPLPHSYRVIATDGSQIEPDRHAPVPCFLINTGEVVLEYGEHPHARLSSEPRLGLDSRSSTPNDDGDEGWEASERVQLDLERSVQEMERLSGLGGAPSMCPTLALQDGSLMLWVAAAERFRHETERYVNRYVAGLEALRLLAGGATLAVAAYTSRPGSAEHVTGLLKSDHQMGSVDGDAQQLVDGELYRFLAPGQRSQALPCDVSRRTVLKWYTPAENLIWSFYLNAGAEVARVEIPAWVAQDHRLLDFVHAAVYQQCRLNFGYPVALMEAHEQAVVSEADRRVFWQLVAAKLERDGLSAIESPKALSKRIPWS